MHVHLQIIFSSDGIDLPIDLMLHLWDHFGWIEIYCKLSNASSLVLSKVQRQIPTL
jgi:hypothetical protein